MSEGEINNIYEALPQGQVKSLVILLHGLGSNGQDLISLAPYFAAKVPDAAFVSPDAPFVCDMVPPGYPNSYQWFSFQDRDPDKMLTEIETAAPILQKFIADQIEKYQIPANKTALVGFSQGTMMSLYAAPRYPKTLAGVLGYSGSMIGEAGPNKIPVRLIHGQADDVVPVEAYAHARSMLERSGFEVSGYTTPGLSHSIDETGIKSGTEFLKSVLL